MIASLLVYTTISIMTKFYLYHCYSPIYGYQSLFSLYCSLSRLSLFSNGGLPSKWLLLANPITETILGGRQGVANHDHRSHFDKDHLSYRKWLQYNTQLCIHSQTNVLESVWLGLITLRRLITSPPENICLNVLLQYLILLIYLS